MTTTYGGTKTDAKNKRKLAVVGIALAAVLATTGAAYAAVKLFGFGEADVAATQLQDLRVDSVAVTAPLLPGATVGAKGVVRNPNGFPVRVTAVIIQAEGAQGVGAGCSLPAVLIPKGIEGDYGRAGTGWRTELTTPVTIGAGGAEEVRIAEAVQQKAGTNMVCGFKANVAVEALAGN
jgi:hypothetical protein